LLLFVFSVASDASPGVHLNRNQSIARQVPDATTCDPRLAANYLNLMNETYSRNSGTVKSCRIWRGRLIEFVRPWLTKVPASAVDLVAGTHLSCHSSGAIRFANGLLRLNRGWTAPATAYFFGGPFLATLAPIKEGAPMENRISRIAAMALSFAVSVASPAAFAQSSTPVRVGNIWDWQDHQPTQAGILQNEKVAGIAPSQRQIDANAVAEQQLYRQLLHRSSGG
jgi:hypothetical protein